MYGKLHKQIYLLNFSPQHYKIFFYVSYGNYGYKKRQNQWKNFNNTLVVSSCGNEEQIALESSGFWLLRQAPNQHISCTPPWPWLLQYWSAAGYHTITCLPMQATLMTSHTRNSWKCIVNGLLTVHGTSVFNKITNKQLTNLTLKGHTILLIYTMSSTPHP